MRRLVSYSDTDANLHAVERLAEAWPGGGVPILSRAKSQRMLFKLLDAGAAEVVPETTEVSLRLGAVLLSQFGLRPDDIADTAA